MFPIAIRSGGHNYAFWVVRGAAGGNYGVHTSFTFRAYPTGDVTVVSLTWEGGDFVHRDADLLFKCEALWEPQDDPDLVVANLDWLEGFHAAMQPYLSGGAYQNFPDRGQEDWQHAYYGANFDRLKTVKRAWDPENVFRYGQSIPVG